MLVALAVLIAGTDARASDSEFYAWLSNYRTQAFNAGISAETINSQFPSIEFLPDVIAKDRNQPEFKLKFTDYKNRVITKQKLSGGRQGLASNHAFLNKIEASYGVPKSVLVALWGIETNYGKITGGYHVLSSLATLAYEGRRAEYFSREFINTLKLMDRYPNLPQPLIGSWAGAMGQCQFMPSTYLKFAIDGNQNGTVNLWNEREDIFASAANYLSQSGWQRGQTWGIPVKLTAPVDLAAADLNIQKSMVEWSRMGLKSAGGGHLPQNTLKASLVLPEGFSGPAFLVYDNYRVIMNWNKSNNFALTVGLLSDKLSRTDKPDKHPNS